jgi:hypothetical protein
MSTSDSVLDRRITRLIRRANHDFGGPDVCHGCRRDLADHEGTLIGRVGSRIKVVGQTCCGNTVSEILGFGVYIATPEWMNDVVAGAEKVMVSLAGTPWGRADRDWFAKNPRRSHRLRPVFPDEWGSEGSFTHSVIRQGKPGERARLPLELSQRFALPDEVPEACAWAIFDLISEHQTGRNRRGITLEEVLARQQLLEAGGKA